MLYLMLKCYGFPKTKKGRWFKKELRKGHYRINIREYNIVVAPFDRRKTYCAGWSVKDIHGTPSGKVAEIGADKASFIHAIKTGWVRGALHEMCHIKLIERFGEEDFFDVAAAEKTDNEDTMFGLFVDRLSPEGFREFLVDELYMRHFQEPEYRKYFKPGVTSSVKMAFERLKKTRRKDYWSFASLFYLFRCACTARRYNEDRPEYQKMVNELKGYKRYAKTLGNLNKMFKDWQFPKNKGELQSTIGQLHKAYRAFLKT